MLDRLAAVFGAAWDHVPVTVKLLARSRPHADTAADSHEWTVEAETYDQAREEARLAVPEGWDLLSVQTVD